MRLKLYLSSSGRFGAEVELDELPADGSVHPATLETLAARAATLMQVAVAAASRGGSKPPDEEDEPQAKPNHAPNVGMRPASKFRPLDAPPANGRVLYRWANEQGVDVLTSATDLARTMFNCRRLIDLDEDQAQQVYHRMEVDATAGSWGGKRP
jgi:hypothetical protein